MYKVFVNDTPIIITSSSQKENNFATYNFKDIIIEEFIYNLKSNNLEGVNLYSTDLEKDWISFTKKITVIPAAGGLVLNKKKEVLFIYRNNVWDLPKGWIEKGESKKVAAIREVEEECGIFNLSIKKKITITYHIYFQDGIKLKKTHWYLMGSNYDKKLKPQIEEGITDVGFKNKEEIQFILKNTYANIKLVYDTYKEN